MNRNEHCGNRELFPYFYPRVRACVCYLVSFPLLFQVGLGVVLTFVSWW